MGILDFFRPKEPTATQVTPGPDNFDTQFLPNYTGGIYDAFGTKIGDPNTPFIMESAFNPKRFKNPVRKYGEDVSKAGDIRKADTINYLNKFHYPHQPNDPERGPLTPPRAQGPGYLQYERPSVPYVKGKTHADDAAGKFYQGVGQAATDLFDPNYKGYFQRQAGNNPYSQTLSRFADTPLTFARLGGNLLGSGIFKTLGVSADVAGIALDAGGNGLMSTDQAQKFSEKLSIMPLLFMEAYGGQIGGMNALARKAYMKEMSKKNANIGFRNALTLQLSGRKQPIFLGMEGATKTETKLLQEATNYAESLMKNADGKTLYSRSPTFIQELVEKKFPGVVFDRKNLVPIIERPIAPSTINELDFLRSTTDLLEAGKKPVNLPLTNFMSKVQKQAFLKYKNSDKDIKKISERLKAKQENGENFTWADLRELELTSKTSNADRLPVLANQTIRRDSSTNPIFSKKETAGAAFFADTGEIVVNTRADSFYVKGVNDAVGSFQSGAITKPEYLKIMTRVAEEYNQMAIHEGIHGLAEGLKKFAQGNNRITFSELSQNLKSGRKVNRMIDPPGVGPKSIFKSPSEKALYEALEVEYKIAKKNNKALSDPDAFKRFGLDYLAYMDDAGEMFARGAEGNLKLSQIRLDTLKKMTKLREEVVNSPQFLSGKRISLKEGKGGTRYAPGEALKIINDTIKMIENGKPGDITYMLNRTQNFINRGHHLKGVGSTTFGDDALRMSRINPTLSHREIIERTLYGRGSRESSEFTNSNIRLPKFVEDF